MPKEKELEVKAISSIEGTIDSETQLEYALFNWLKKRGLYNSSTAKTPERFIKALSEITGVNKQQPEMTVFNKQGYSQMICDLNIPFYTLCEHHLLPFFGSVSIAYIPDTKVVGLSKLSRVVDYHAKSINTQEYFTENIANHIEQTIRPLGLGVYVKARHLCREMRGAKSQGSMITTALRGNFLLDASVKNEFLNYIR